MKKLKYQNYLGYDSFSLFHPELGEIKEYRKYVETISLAGKLNTTKDTAQDLKRFFEYIYAFPLVEDYKDQCLNSTVLSSLIMGYPKYLTEGKDASGLPGQIAKLTQSKTLANTSANRLLSTVRIFLEHSSQFHSDLQSLKNQDLIDIDVDPSELFEDLNTRRKLTNSERQAMMSKSMLAGVISGGAKYTKSRLFHALSTQENSLVDKAFPHKYAIEVLDKANTYRDLCFWALLFGTGIRHSEGLQLLLKDIDAKNREIFTIDPTLRPAEYASLPNDWKNKLTWKGREIQTVYFLEPFKSIFFNNLANCLKERKKEKCTHQFLFISMDNAHPSRPHYLTSNGSLNKTFRSAQMRIWKDKEVVADDGDALHSIRHFYGVWMLNYLYLGEINGEKRYGLSPSSVQTLMGHASEVSTKRYAVKDKFILQATIQLANALIEKTKANPEEIVTQALEYNMTKAKEKFLGIESRV